MDFETHILNNAITICGWNRECDEINQRELNKIDKKSFVFSAKTEGDVKSGDHAAPERLLLKAGARVIILVNGQSKRQIPKWKSGYRRTD